MDNYHYIHNKLSDKIEPFHTILNKKSKIYKDSLDNIKTIRNSLIDDISESYDMIVKKNTNIIDKNIKKIRLNSIHQPHKLTQKYSNINIFIIVLALALLFIPDAFLAEKINNYKIKISIILTISSVLIWLISLDHLVFSKKIQLSNQNRVNKKPISKKNKIKKVDNEIIDINTDNSDSLLLSKINNSVNVKIPDKLDYNKTANKIRNQLTKNKSRELIKTIDTNIIDTITSKKKCNDRVDLCHYNTKFNKNCASKCGTVHPWLGNICCESNCCEKETIANAINTIANNKNTNIKKTRSKIKKVPLPNNKSSRKIISQEDQTIVKALEIIPSEEQAIKNNLTKNITYNKNKISDKKVIPDQEQIPYIIPNEDENPYITPNEEQNPYIGASEEQNFNNIIENQRDLINKANNKPAKHKLNLNNKYKMTLFTLLKSSDNISNTQKKIILNELQNVQRSIISLKKQAKHDAIVKEINKIRNKQ